jgi:hypothetical protein
VLRNLGMVYPFDGNARQGSDCCNEWLQRSVRPGHDENATHARRTGKRQEGTAGVGDNGFLAVRSEGDT